MRVLLMLPYDSAFDRDMPDLGLGYLTACLERDGHSVKLCIRKQELISPVILKEFIRQQRFDLIGIKVMSSSVIDSKQTIAIIREADENAIIVLGGAHPSCDPAHIFDLIPEAGYAFYGEAEIGLVEFVKEVNSGDLSERVLSAIPGLIWKRGSETIINTRQFVEDLDSLPFPAWKLMKPSNFPHVPFNGYSRRYPIAPMLLTRGCPSRCTFCAAESINGPRFRSRSADNILAEIKLLTTDYGVKEIQFFDSNCANSRGPLREVCKRLIAENINITWCAPNGIRVDSIDAELAGLMKRSGCFQVNVGIESGSSRILKMIKKGISPDLVREKVCLLRDAGIEVVGFFMIGFPGETAAEIQQTISFALELPLTGASFSILNPLPGTSIYEELYKNHGLDLEILNSLDFINYENNLSEVNFKQLRRIQRNAYLRFHSRPHIIWYLLKNLNSLRKIQFIVHRVNKILFKN